MIDALAGGEFPTLMMWFFSTRIKTLVTILPVRTSINFPALIAMREDDDGSGCCAVTRAQSKDNRMRTSESSLHALFIQRLQARPGFQAIDRVQATQTEVCATEGSSVLDRSGRCSRKTRGRSFFRTSRPSPFASTAAAERSVSP